MGTYKRIARKRLDEFIAKLCFSPVEVKRLNMLIAEYYASHWRDDENPEIEFKMRKSWCYCYWID